MNPWFVIGWVILSLFIVLGLLLVYASLSMVRRMVKFYIRYWKTKNIIPEEGQVWEGASVKYTIERVLENGILVLKSGNASWGETPEEWKKRVYYRRLRKVG